MKRPTAAAWKQRSEPNGDTLRFATVHSCKGREYPAVLLAIKSTVDRGPIADWRDGRNTEARRVLYVGASRAQRLLAFGCSGPTSTLVTELLEAANVPAVRL